MKTLNVSKFKASCLGLLRDVRATGEPMAVTLRGQVIAVVQPPDEKSGTKETVAQTLARMRPLLMAEEEDMVIPSRSTRAQGLHPFDGH